MPERRSGLSPAFPRATDFGRNAVSRNPIAREFFLPWCQSAKRLSHEIRSPLQKLITFDNIHPSQQAGPVW